MSVCKHYLRGNCKFGDHCRNPHVDLTVPHMHPQNPTQPRYRPRPQLDAKYKYVASSNNNTNDHVRHRTEPTKTSSKYGPLLIWVNETFINKEKALDILEQIQTEAKVWLKSSLWRFTSRSLFPGGRPLESWTDQSFEEIHWAHRWMTNGNQEHLYKKAYFDYLEIIERQLLGASKLDLDTIKSLKVYIDQYIASEHKPSKTLPSDIHMKDDNDLHPTTMHPRVQSTHYTDDDQLLADERAAFESETFQLGSIPVHAPSRQFC